MKLSIITINYNNREGLQNTIDSIISQTWKDFEWIIIDGGSTDGSKELIEKYQDNFAYWCSEPDNGVYNAMNKGIDRATGDYLNFMNSGDCFFSYDTLQKVFKHYRSADILYGDAVISNQGIMKGFQSDFVFGDDLIRSTINHQASFFKRELFVICGYYDENLKIVSDWKFYIEAILIHQCSVKYLGFTVAVCDENGISRTRGELAEKERIRVLREYLPDFIIKDYLAAHKVNEVLKYRYSRIFFSILYRIVMLYEKKKRYIRI